MLFKNYDGLRSFTVVARHGSVSAAADELCLTKGAISHQIRTLERQLGFELFHREPRGVRTTHKGQRLLHSVRSAFEAVNQQIDLLRDEGRRAVTLGLSTYLASRWLSPRLTEFLGAHPSVRLRLQPMIGLYDLERDGVDLAIRWGKGEWTDILVRPLFVCPAFPVAAPGLAAAVKAEGLAALMDRVTLLHDREGSTAWADWFEVAGLRGGPRAAMLIIPDPNVRVQAVVDGQGVALNDRFVGAELADGRLVRLSPHELAGYGYHLAYASGALANADVAALARWLALIAVEA
ncbi:MAG: LysR substrate-binding domain-containing protein [Burkholderiaceae bacterium]